MNKRGIVASALTLAILVSPMTVNMAQAQEAESSESVSAQAILWIHEDYFNNYEKAVNGDEQALSLLAELKEDINNLRKALDDNNLEEAKKIISEVESSKESLAQYDTTYTVPVISLGSGDLNSVINTIRNADINDDDKSSAIANIENSLRESGLTNNQAALIANQIANMVNESELSVDGKESAVISLAVTPISAEKYDTLKETVERSRLNANQKSEILNLFADRDSSRSDMNELRNLLAKSHVEWDKLSQSYITLANMGTITTEARTNILNLVIEDGADQSIVDSLNEKLVVGALTSGSGAVEAINSSFKSPELKFRAYAELAKTAVVAPEAASQFSSSVHSNNPNTILSTFNVTEEGSHSITDETINVSIANNSTRPLDTYLYDSIVNVIGSEPISISRADALNNRLSEIGISSDTIENVRALLAENEVDESTIEEIISELGSIGVDTESADSVSERVLGDRKVGDVDRSAEEQKNQLVKAVDTMIKSINDSGVLDGSAVIGDPVDNDSSGNNIDPDDHFNIGQGDSSNLASGEEKNLANTGSATTGTIGLLLATMMAGILSGLRLSRKK